MMRSLPIAALGAALLAPTLASATGPPAAVIEFRTEGEIAPAVRGKLSESLHAGLNAGLSITSLTDSTAALQGANPGLVDCQDKACFKEMARTVGHRVLIQASARSEMEFYHLGLTATDATTGAVLLNANGVCEICTLAEAATKLRTTSERFSADLGPIVSALPADKPVTAAVRAGGGPTARPPSILTPPPPAGGGFPEAPPAPSGDAKPAPAPAATAAASLPPVPGPDPTPPGPADPPPQMDEFPYGVAAFGALAGGLLLLGTGGVLIAQDGDSTCGNQPLQKCPTVYDTGQAGLVTVVVGGAGLLTSVVLFLMQQAASGLGPETPPRLPRLPSLKKDQPGAAWQITW